MMHVFGFVCITSGTRRSNCLTRFWWEGCVDSHSGMVGWPVNWSLISICCQKTVPALTSAHACQKCTHISINTDKEMLVWHVKAPPSSREANREMTHTTRWALWALDNESREQAGSRTAWIMTSRASRASLPQQRANVLHRAGCGRPDLGPFTSSRRPVITTIRDRRELTVSP